MVEGEEAPGIVVAADTWAAEEIRLEKAFGCGSCMRLRVCDLQMLHQERQSPHDCPSYVRQIHLRLHPQGPPVYRVRLRMVVHRRQDKMNRALEVVAGHSGVGEDSQAGCIAVEESGVEGCRMVVEGSETEGHMVAESSHKVAAGSSFGLGVGRERMRTDCQLCKVVVVVQVGSTPVSQEDSSLQLVVGSDKVAVGPEEEDVVLALAIGLDSGMEEVADCFRDRYKEDSLGSCWRSNSLHL